MSQSTRGWLLVGLLGVLGCAPGETAPGDDTAHTGGDDGLDDQAGEGDDGESADGASSDDGDEDSSVSVGVGGGATPKPCGDASECDDGDPCTEDSCDGSGELGSFCAHAPIDRCESEEDDGGDPGDLDGAEDPEDPDFEGGPDDAIDATCDDGPQTPVFLPYEPLGAVDLPESCDGGFEWQVCQSSLLLDAPGGTAEGTLVVDLATYTAPDRLRILGERADGTTYLLMDTCRVRTAEYMDPTNGHQRPPEDSIRRFELDLEEGTRSLTIDSTGAGTPFYLRVLGLCAFDLEAEGQTCGTYRTAG